MYPSTWILRLLSGVVVGVALEVAAANSAFAMGSAPGQFGKIVIVGEDPRNGLFDVAVEYGDDGTGWLVYSRVEIPQHVETHLAKSTDQGKTWTYVDALNRSIEGSDLIEGTMQKGVWRYETPTLIYDPTDAAARRWKFFVQRYLSTPPHEKNNSHFGQGWIEYRYAASPVGPWSEGMCIFGKSKDRCQADLNSLHSDLKNIAFYNELGSIVVDGVIYLSMDASATSSGLGEWEQRKVVLFRSRDHGASWAYVGTLTDYDDANELGYVVLTGSSMVREEGRLFLLITPSGAKGLFKKNRAHDGTLVVEFADIRRAALKRDAKGGLAVLKTIKPDRHSGGLSDYDERNVNGGMLFSQITLDEKPEFFQVFTTGEQVAR